MIDKLSKCKNTLCNSNLSGTCIGNRNKRRSCKKDDIPIHSLDVRISNKRIKKELRRRGNR